MLLYANFNFVCKSKIFFKTDNYLRHSTVYKYTNHEKHKFMIYHIIYNNVTTIKPINFLRSLF